MLCVCISSNQIYTQTLTDTWNEKNRSTHTLIHLDMSVNINPIFSYSVWHNKSMTFKRLFDFQATGIGVNETWIDKRYFHQHTDKIVFMMRLFVLWTFSTWNDFVCTSAMFNRVLFCFVVFFTLLSCITRREQTRYFLGQQSTVK